MSNDPLIVHMSGQCLIFLRACLCGAALALFCDFFRVLRRVFRCPNALIAAQDLFCCTVFCLGSFLFLLSHCSGRLRWFGLAGELLGAVLYWTLLGEIVVRAGAWILGLLVGALRWIIGLLKRVFGLFWRLLSWPIGKIRAILQGLYKSSKKILKKGVKRIKFCLKQHAVLLYNSSKTRLGGRSLPKDRRNGRE